MGRKDEKADLLTRDQAARALGITTRTLTNYASRSEDPLQPIASGRGVKSLYDPAEVYQWGWRRELAKLQTEASDNEFIDYQLEKARLTRAQADRVELRNDELRGELARIDVLKFALGQIGSQVAAQLDTLPAKLKRAVPKLTSTEIQLIKKVITKCQNTAAKARVRNWNAYRPEDETGD